MTRESNFIAQARRQWCAGVVLFAAFFAVSAQSVRASLVYQAPEQRVMVAADDGSHTRLLARGVHPTISPDGRWVTYVTRDRRRVVLVRVSGRMPREIARGPHNAPMGDDGVQTAWSRDSKLVATTEVGSRLVVYDLDAHASRARVLDTPDLTEPTFSPSGRRVAYAQLLDVSGFIGWTTTRGAPSGAILTIRKWQPRLGTDPVWGPRGIALREFDGDRYDVGDLNSFVFVSDSTGRHGHHLSRSSDCRPVAWISADALLAVRVDAMNREQPVYLGIDRQPVAALPDFFGRVISISADHHSILALDGDAILRVSLTTGARQLLGHGVAPSWSG
jgi:dipeptidyl aminopeptidase/acylaminoacyl peptidase